MRTDSPPLVSRLALGAPEERDDALAWRCLGLLLALYTLSHALFYPGVITNVDESHYLRQAALIAAGTNELIQVDAFHGRPVRVLPAHYPIGVGALMAPLVAGFGWRGAYAVPMLGLLAAVVLTGLCLRQEGRSPLFALLIFGFAPALVMSRVAMSDVPSAAIVALGLLCFFRGLDGPVRWWLAAGFVAGASLTFRATNPLVFAPLFAGTVLRREFRCWALIVGGLAGVALRLAAMQWFYGDALMVRSYYRFEPFTLPARLPLYALGLLVMVPGGLVAAGLYRGRRRPEVIAAITLFVCFYLFQGFSSEASSTTKRVVLALRYMIPLLPLLVLACAESVPRLWQRRLDGLATEARTRAGRRATAALVGALAGFAVAGALVHPVFAWWSAGQADIRDAIRTNVPADAVLVTNAGATYKFVDELERRFLLIDSAKLESAAVRLLAERHDEFYVALLDRNDSPFWRKKARHNAEFLDRLRIPRKLVLDLEPSASDRLRIWRLALDERAQTRWRNAP